MLKIAHPYRFDELNGRVICNGCGRSAKYALHIKDRYPIVPKMFRHTQGCQVEAEQKKEVTGD
jgi:hypothetical protein